jgi:hypothetical protein
MTTETATVRLYGRPLADPPDGGHLSFIYCGFAAGDNDVRTPSSRTFYVRKGDVLSSGEVADYTIGDTPVRYVEVPLTAEVHESRPRRISLAHGLLGGPGQTFGALVATPPRLPVQDTSGLAAMSRDELMGSVRRFLQPGAAGFDPAVAAEVETMQASYYWSGWIWLHLDPYGGDIDHELPVVLEA